MFGRQKAAALVAEFLGAGILTLLVLSVQRSTIGVPFFVAIAAGLTITVMMFAVSSISGGHFNPALTIGLWTARKVTTARAIVYIAAQLLGAWGAYYLYTYFVHNSLQPVGGHYTGRILVAEAVGTGIFAFGWASALYQRYSTAVTASVAGLSYMLGIIAASSAALGLLNPALALGTRAWVWTTYVLGPVLGAIIGVNLYNLLFTEDGAGNLAAAVSGSTSSSTPAVAAKPKKSSGKKKK
ncbi:MAG TPA: aquaporin [Candidatus Saccharimonadales bacterium]|nr:aquaporin [Candidatus Saccharimonadales bacterium]